MLSKFKSAALISVSLITGSICSQNPAVVDAASRGESFEHCWSNTVGAGRANEGLRAGWLEQLSRAKEECGFKYVRFHGLFHDDMFPYFEENGKAVYNWQYIDDLFDRMLDMGVKPFVELAFFPSKIAAENSKTTFWWKAAVTPNEAKFENWKQLVKAFTQHCVDRYGRDEVLSWYFEVWNEPNLDRGFFDGTKSQYFELYKLSAQAVKSVDSRFRIGGPSTSNFVSDARFDGEREDRRGFEEAFSTNDINTLTWHGVWIEDFLKYCKKEKLPVDFVSCHPYPTGYALDPVTQKGKGLTRNVGSTKTDIEWLKKILAKSAFPKAEIHLTEWSTSPNSRDAMHDYLPAAAYIVKTNIDCIGLVNSLSYWTFTDIFEEKGGAPSIFHGGFGMINFQGLVKPSYHAYQMLNKLGNQELYRKDNLFVTRSEKTGKVTAIAYNYPQEYWNAVPSGNNKLAKGSSRELNLSLKNLRAGAVFEISTLDENHGNIHNTWESIGKPEPPNREQIKYLKTKAEELGRKIVTADKDGSLVIKETLTS
ncbi:hypothetical protein [uncultured Flavobacterium sp.]|uniref:GH39 family glycosyl hydrolase n=1 Tax=uncultured Flavobacterium sp. TaxID=165435 RepID=UPI002594FED8|nr:hypothetical protein [uncultured Flavobacterium sp.]